MASIFPLAVSLFLIIITILIILVFIFINFTSYIIYPECKDIDKDKLVQINNKTIKCDKKDFYYIKEYDLTVSKTPVPVENVCLQYCTDPECKGKDERKNYLECLAIFDKIKCNGIPPLAYKNKTLFYGYSPGECTNIN